MADATMFPADIEIGQWQRPEAPNPRLASPITASDTTLNLTAPFKDETNTVITGNFLGGMKNAGGYVETFYAPPGSVSVDGLTISGVIRGVRLSGIDYTTGDGTLAAAFDQDSPVYCNVSAVLFQLMIAAMTGGIASGGTSWNIGNGTDVDITVAAFNADVNKPYFRYDAATNQWIFSNDGVSSTPFGTGAGVVGGDGVTVSSGTISIDLTDTTTFVATSAGAPDAGKVPVLNGSGQLDSSFINFGALVIENLNTVGTANAAIASGNAVAFDNERLGVASSAALNTAFVPAGIATTSAAGAGNTFNYAPLGSVVTVPSLASELSQGRTFFTAQQNGSSNVTTDQVFGTNWRGQTFTPATNETNVGSVILNLTSNGVPTGTYTAEIYATSGGLPTGAALTSGVLSTANMANGDNEFVLSPVLLTTPGTEYAIVLSNAAALAGNNYSWNYQNTDVYAGGTRVVSSNSGSTWTADATADYRFKVKMRTIQGEPVFLSTGGALTLTPPTFVSRIGTVQSLTEVAIHSAQKMVYGTISTSIDFDVSATVTTDVTLGIRPTLMLIQYDINASGGIDFSLAATNFLQLLGESYYTPAQNYSSYFRRLRHPSQAPITLLKGTTVSAGVAATAAPNSVISFSLSWTPVNAETFRFTRTVSRQASAANPGVLPFTITFVALL